MNALDEPRLGFELEREMATADRALMVVSFVQWRGWQRLEARLSFARRTKCSDQAADDHLYRSHRFPRN